MMGGMKGLDPVSPVLTRAALKTPLPLLDPEHKVMVLFSPKSACSTVAMWFFSMIGHLKAARDFAPGPHGYRQFVYYWSDLHRRALSDDLSTYTVIRVIRDPYDRVASSFRHALKTGYADKELEKALPGYDPKERGISFSEFVDFLATEDLATCNVHHRRQSHPIEELLTPHHVINITQENLFTRANEVEAQIGLPLTDFQGITWAHENEKKRDVRRVEMVEDASGKLLTRNHAKSGPWPSSKNLLSPAMRERIAALYPRDVELFARDPA